MATLQWNMLGTAPSHVFYPFLQAPGATWRPVEWTAAPVLQKKGGHKISREMRVGALWYGPYGIQHIETINKIIKPNTIFSRSSVLGSTSSPAKKLTFFLRIWQERAG